MVALLVGMVEQKEEDEVVVATPQMIQRTEVDEEGWDSGITSFMPQTWMTDKVLNATLQQICEVKGYRYGRNHPEP